MTGVFPSITVRQLQQRLDEMQKQVPLQGSHQLDSQACVVRLVVKVTENLPEHISLLSVPEAAT